jgi:ribonuclease-3
MSVEEQLAARFGHRFNRPEHLERALTHSSWIAENSAARSESQAQQISEKPGDGASPPTTTSSETAPSSAPITPELSAPEDNEKYEFLGDAVLTLVVSESLLGLFPAWREGQLSKARASLVNAVSLAEAARRLNLGSHLRLGRGEEKTGGRDKPAILADAFEAVIAAIFLDGGLDAARRFVERTLLGAALEENAQPGGRLGQPDHKSRLQEFLQARGWPAAEYRVLSESGPDHRKVFEVEVHVAGRATAEGRGRSKKEAEQAAASGAMAQILEAVARTPTGQELSSTSRAAAEETNG